MSPEKNQEELISDVSSLIIDMGSSGICKAGFSGDDFPKYTFHSILNQGRPRSTFYKLFNPSYYNYPTVHPIDENGIVTDWDNMETIWHRIFYEELKVNPEEYPVFLTEMAISTKTNREKMTQIMFEKFNIPAMYLANQSVLSLYASGRTTGVVVDSGDGLSHCVPVYEGYAMTHAIQQNDVGGRHLTEYLARLMTQRGYYFTTRAEKNVVKDIKVHLNINEFKAY